MFRSESDNYDIVRSFILLELSQRMATCQAAMSLLQRTYATVENSIYDEFISFCDNELCLLYIYDNKKIIR